jgi:NAD(P)H-hydrate repair Nnr-like enzyme with NAD(P)H-hydrate dehydratase domain
VNKKEGEKRGGKKRVKILTPNVGYLATLVPHEMAAAESDK